MLGALRDHRPGMRQCWSVVTVSSNLTPKGGSAKFATALLLMASLGATTVACTSNEAPNAERFCGEVAANKEALTAPQLVYDNDIDPLLDLYRGIAALAPLGVEDDWAQIVTAYETASTVVIGDEASEQQALAAIYSSERSAAAVDAWLQANCAVDIGPVFTIVAQS